MWGLWYIHDTVSEATGMGEIVQGEGVQTREGSPSLVNVFLFLLES